MKTNDAHSVFSSVTKNLIDNHRRYYNTVYIVNAV